MKSVSVRTLAGIISGIVVVAGLVGFLLRPDVPPLKGARPVLSLSGAHPNYWWLSTRDVLLAREGTPPHFVRCDITSKTETPQPALDALFEKSGGQLETVRISVDGQYLLWSSKDQMKTTVARVDGSESHEVRHKRWPTISLWHPDNHEWVALTIMLQNRIGTATFYERTISPAKARPKILSETLLTEETNVTRAIITDREQLLAQHWQGPDHPTDRAELIAAGFTANPSAANNFTLPAPYPENEGAEVLFSSDQMQMGWVIRFQQPLDRALGNGKRPLMKFNTGFWVFHRKSNKTTSFGYLPTVRGDDNSGPFNVQFTPDTTGISYVYNNTLYVLPIPEQ